MARTDPIDVIEAAYGGEGASGDAWVEQLAAALLPALDRGFGVSVEAFDLSRSEPIPGGHCLRVEHRASAGSSPVAGQLCERLASFVPAPMLSIYRFPHLVSSVRANTPPDPRVTEAWRAVAGPYGVGDVFGVSACEPDGRGVLVMSPRARRARLDEATRARWIRVAVHLSAALRLRAPARARTLPDAEDVDAVLRADGRVEHARGPAVEERDALRRAAMDLDRARGRLRREDSDRALDLWRGLVEGRWSLIDFFDSDGRRYVLARRNAPSWSGPLALSERERQVAVSVGAGSSNKLVAYELGVSVSTVATHLAAAMRKLGLRRRADLVAVVAAFLGRGGA